MKRHSAIASGVVVAAVLAFAPAASATTRFVSPTGLPTAACTEGAPCDLSKAAIVALAGDTIQLAPGSHSVTSLATINAPNVRVVAAPGGARPVVTATGVISGISFGPAATGGEVLNLEFVSVGGIGGSGPITAAAPITVDNIAVNSDGGCASLTSPNSTLTNSTFTQTNSTGVGCVVMGEGATMRNVTVSTIGTFPGAGAVQFTGGGVTVDRLKVTGISGVSLGNPVFPITTGDTSTFRRLDVAVSSGAVALSSTPALSLFGPAVVTDSLLRSSSTSGIPGFGSAVAVTTAADARFRNVTAIASGLSAQALLVQPAATQTSVSVKNSILRGDVAANDVNVLPGNPGVTVPPGCTVGMIGCIVIPSTVAANVAIENSNLRGGTGSITQTANQTDDPQFTNAAGGNFRPQAGSPAIDAGVDDPDNGSFDLDGNTRKQGAATDMGAYELVVPPPPVDETPQQQQQQPTTPSGGGEPVITPPAPDRIAPGLSALALTNKTFAVAASSTPVAARTKKGTTFVYTLSEPATTTITIERATTGRRKGKSCVKATSKNRKAKKCTLYVKAGTLTRKGTNGANAVPFSGRIGRKALKPATYRASFVAVDAAGNKSKPRTVGFKVVKK